MTNYFISPPFGNYIHLPKTISIYGSFTIQPRNGLLRQMIKTLRYIPKYRGWVNAIGLRNKGISWALKNVPENQIISIAIMNFSDIDTFLSQIPENRNIEINISCPNVDKNINYKDLGKFVNPKRKWCIIKLSPKVSQKHISELYFQGFRQFHCCNTLPVPEGGLSGIALRPYVSSLLTLLRENYKDVVLIAGGGISSIQDMEYYNSYGADHFSISTGLWKIFWKFF